MDAIRRQLRLLDEELDERASLHSQFFARSPLVLPACGLIAGIVLQSFLNSSILWPIVILLGCMAGCALSLRYQKMRAKIYVIAYCAVAWFVCLGAIRLINYYQPGPNDIRNFVGEEKILATITGGVITEPKFGDRESWKFGRYTWTKPGTSFYLALESIKTKTGWAKVTGTVRLQVGAKADHVKAGDRAKMYCWLDRFSEPLNPGEFNIAKYLAKRRVFIAVSVKSSDGIEILDHSGATTFTGLKNKLKSIAAQALLTDITPDEQSSGLLAALLLGQRAKLDGATYDAFRETGLAHFISLSGLHVGILVGFIWWLCRRANLSKRWRAIVCIIVICWYVLIVPPRAPTLRAAILCVFFCLSVIIHRKINPLNTLSLTAIVLLLFRPSDLFQPGWQLSFATVLGIILLEQRIENRLLTNTVDKMSYLQTTKDQNPFVILLRRVLIYVIAMFSVGVAAWLGGAGILLYHFGMITPMASVWTPLVFPVVLAILAVGFLKIAIAALLPTLALVLGIIATHLSDFLIWAVRNIADWDISGVLIGEVSVVVILCYYFFILFIRFGYLRKHRVKNIICTVTAAAIFISLGITKYQRTYRRDLEITCLSVGHGQAIFIALPGRKKFLFDAGSLSTKNCGQRIVLPFLRNKGISTLDGIILSHDDIDHINGVPEIVSGCTIRGVYANTAILEEAKTLSTAGYLDDCITKAGTQLKLFDTDIDTVKGAKVTSLWPTMEVCLDKTVSDNDKSQVVLIKFAGRKILLCSDIEIFGQEKILLKNPNLEVDVMVMPHHGSTRNLLDGFVEKINPKTSIISCMRTRKKSAFVPTPPARAFYTPTNGAVTVKVTSTGEITTTGFITSGKSFVPSI